MSLPVGAMAPDFELPSLGVSASVRLRDLLKGGAVFLAFVKENCPTCRYTLTLINRIYLNYPSSQVAMRVIAQETEGEATKLAQELGLRVPMLLDGAPYVVSGAYGMSFVPTCYFISSAGSIEVVMEAFERDKLDIINRRIATAQGVEAVPFFTAIEGVPDFKPG